MSHIVKKQAEHGDSDDSVADALESLQNWKKHLTNCYVIGYLFS
jgi:hypothetical protein